MATHAYAHANKLTFLVPVARIAGDIAFIAWALTAFDLVRQLRAHDAKSVSEV